MNGDFEIVTYKADGGCWFAQIVFANGRDFTINGLSESEVIAQATRLAQRFQS